MFYTLALCTMIADLLIPFFVAIPYKGYNHKTTVMSVLGCNNSPLRWFYNIWMVFSGSVISLLGYHVFKEYQEVQYSLAVSLFILLILYGVGDEVLSGIFPVNENKEDVNLSCKIHGVGSVIGFIALLFAPLVLAIIQFKLGDSLLGIISFLCFMLSFVFFIFFIMGDKPKFKNTIFALEGLWQRVICFVTYIPFIITILKTNY